MTPASRKATALERENVAGSISHVISAPGARQKAAEIVSRREVKPATDVREGVPPPK